MKFRIGSRGSALALAQVELLKARARELAPEFEFELVVVKTSGDRKQGTPEAAVSDKRDWIHELELGVVAGELDGALHCGKDVPCEIAGSTELIPILKRATPFDIFIGRSEPESGRRISFEELPEGATVGTASLRRAAQLRRLRPDLRIVPIRGNVQTRIRKLDQGEAEGLVLAGAGIERLGEAIERRSFTAEQMLPAVNQGMLCIQLRRENESLRKALASLVRPGDAACFFAERKVAEVLNGDCRSAIAIYAELTDGQLRLRSAVYAREGAEMISAEATGAPDRAAELGEQVAVELLSRGARKLLD